MAGEEENHEGSTVDLPADEGGTGDGRAAGGEEIVLNRDNFSKETRVVAIKIPAKRTSEVMKRLRKELLNMPKRRNVEPCPGDESKRLLLLRPVVRDPVTLDGETIDGTEFDSSFKRGKPTTFAPNQVIKGWTEAMQMMTEGDYWQLVIPSELAYGDSQRGQFITPGAVLVFELELIEVKGPGAVKAEL